MKPAPAGAIGWDHPATARYYDAFDRRHRRYREANAELVRHAVLEPGQRVLDVAAGLGGTARAALRQLGQSGEVVCLEPAAAMRTLGEGRLDASRTRWIGTWPRSGGRFDRILCGAAIWLLLPLRATFARCHRLLTPGGSFCFNIPSLYLRQPDEPGGGADPMLLALPAALAEGHRNRTRARAPLPDVAGIESLLAAFGFRPERWSFRVRLTQRAYRDWLKLPPITDALLAGVASGERVRRVNAAFRKVDAESWRWEHWTGWTAWKPAA